MVNECRSGFSIRSLLVLIAVSAFGVMAAVHCLGPIVPGSTVAEIKTGASKQQVLDLLGAPNSPLSESAWCYERTMNPGWLVVHFDVNGDVEYVDHEQVFP